MSEFPNYDESIPVLTEVVREVPPVPAQEPAPEPEPIDNFAESVAGTLDLPAALAPIAAANDDAWKTLEERLVARVLDRLQGRIELVLEDEIRAHMSPILDNVVARLAVELHAGLEATVTQVVARAVAQELAHLHWNPA
jgi:hypothetical protein